MALRARELRAGVLCARELCARALLQIYNKSNFHDISEYLAFITDNAEPYLVVMLPDHKMPDKSCDVNIIVRHNGIDIVKSITVLRQPKSLVFIAKSENDGFSYDNNKNLLKLQVPLSQFENWYTDMAECGLYGFQILIVLIVILFFYLFLPSFK